jgi:hypothetical protein
MSDPHTHRSLRGEARNSRSANDVAVCSWEVYVPRHTAGKSSHFIPMQARVSRYASCARPSADDVGNGNRSRWKAHNTRDDRFFCTAPTYGRLLALLLQCSLLYICCRSPNRHAPTFLVRCASQKLLYFLHAHRKKTKHS